MANGLPFPWPPATRCKRAWRCWGLPAERRRALWESVHLRGASKLRRVAVGIFPIVDLYPNKIWRCAEGWFRGGTSGTTDKFIQILWFIEDWEHHRRKNFEQLAPHLFSTFILKPVSVGAGLSRCFVLQAVAGFGLGLVDAAALLATWKRKGT